MMMGMMLEVGGHGTDVVKGPDSCHLQLWCRHAQHSGYDACCGFDDGRAHESADDDCDSSCACRVAGGFVLGMLVVLLFVVCRS